MIDCDFDVRVSVISSAGVEVVNLNNHAIGLSVASHQEPEETYREVRSVAPRVPGSSLAASVEDDGILLVNGLVTGASWAQCQGRWESAKMICKAEVRFEVEVEVEGVVRRWEAERPEIVPAPVSAAAIRNARQEYQMRFRVQPGPAVTIA